MTAALFAEAEKKVRFFAWNRARFCWNPFTKACTSNNHWRTGLTLKLAGPV